MGSDQSIDATTLDEFLLSAQQQMQEDRRNNFRIICLTSELPWNDLLGRFEARFSITEQGELYELHATYTKHEQDFDVFLYLYEHPDTHSPIILTLNSHDDFNRTADSMITRTEGLYYLWFPPNEMALLKEDILDREGSKLVEFEGKKFGRERKYEEERRPGTRRKGEYEGDDAADTLEERKKEYGITPTHLYFEWPTKGDFHFRDEGEFVLTRGDPEFFFNEIVAPGLSKVEPMNTAIKSSELHIVEREGVDQIEKETLEISLTTPLEYDERGALIDQMKNEGFYPYSMQTAEGSLLLNGRVVDESNGGMISVSTDGETVSILPRYESGFDSLLRFYRFVVEEVDSDAKVAAVS